MRTGPCRPAKAPDPGPQVNGGVWEEEASGPATLPEDGPAPPWTPEGTGFNPPKQTAGPRADFWSGRQHVPGTVGSPCWAALSLLTQASPRAGSGPHTGGLTLVVSGPLRFRPGLML